MYIMGSLFDSLKDYFENTPQDVLERDWREIEYLNEIGPDVIEYANFIKESLGIAVPYANANTKLNGRECEVSECLDNGKARIAADALYCLAA